MAMVLVVTLNAWGGVVFQDNFTIPGDDNTTPNPALWTDMGYDVGYGPLYLGTTHLANDQLVAQQMDEIRTIQTFDLTTPDTATTFQVDMIGQNSGGYEEIGDCAILRVYGDNTSWYLQLRVYNLDGYANYSGMQVILNRFGDGQWPPTILYDSGVVTPLGSYPMTAQLTLDATNVMVRLLNGPMGDGVLFYGPHGMWQGTTMTAVRMGLCNGNTGQVDPNDPPDPNSPYATQTMDNATVSTGPGLSAAQLQGSVVLDEYTGDTTYVGALIELIQSGSVVKTSAQLLGSDGSFSVSNVIPGTYDVAIKTYGHQRKVLSAISIWDNPTVLAPVHLTAGDNNGDNVTTSADLAIILGHMDQAGDQ